MRILLLLLLLVATPSVCRAVELEVGDVPPSDIGFSADSERLSLADMEGKVVVVTFWATWCGPCLEELTVLEGIQAQVSTDELRVIGVNYKEGRRQFRKIKNALSEAQLTLSYDPGGRIARRYGVDSVPHMFIIGRDGRIAGIHVGYSESRLVGIVDELNALLIDRRGSAPEAE